MSFRARLMLLVTLLLLLGGAVVGLRGGSASATPGAAQEVTPDAAAMAPAGVRIRVEVLNASGVRGLARQATMHLRDHGYDVVAMGNAPDRLDSTQVLLRSGEEEWAQRVARAMAAGPPTVRRDSSRHLDVTVLVGRSWRPPSGPFRP